jgi:hypothetical protein
MKSSSGKLAFTMLELQVALVLLTFGLVTLASLLATQTRVEKRLQNGFASGSTIYLTQSKDPWVRALGAPARITTQTFAQTTPSSVSAVNQLTIVDRQQDLNAETMTVTVDLSPASP